MNTTKKTALELQQYYQHVAATFPLEAPHPGERVIQIYTLPAFCFYRRFTDIFASQIKQLPDDILTKTTWCSSFELINNTLCKMLEKCSQMNFYFLNPVNELTELRSNLKNSYLRMNTTATTEAEVKSYHGILFSVLILDVLIVFQQHVLVFNEHKHHKNLFENSITEQFILSTLRLFEYIWSKRNDIDLHNTNFGIRDNDMNLKLLQMNVVKITSKKASIEKILSTSKEVELVLVKDLALLTASYCDVDMM